MIRAVKALSEFRERENQRYLKGSHEEKVKVREDWGIIDYPTEEQIEHRRSWCESVNRMTSVTHGAMAGIIPGIAAGFATIYYLGPYYDSGSLEGLLPTVMAPLVFGGVVYASVKAGNLLHRRKHPTGRECHEEYYQRGLELIAELENRVRK